MSRHGAYPRPAPLRAAGLCGIASALCFVAADALGSALRPGYSPVSDAISELIETGAPNKALIDAFLLGFHGLVIPFAIGLHREVRARPRGWIAPLFLAGAGCLGVVLTLFFPCDPGCRPLTPRGTAHIFIAVPMGFSVVLSILAFSWRFGADPDWRGWRGYSRATFAVAIGLAVLTVALAETRFVGVSERALTLAYLQWYVAVGVKLARPA